MNPVKMSDKLELSALQLVYLLNDTLETLCLLAEDGQEIDTMKIASEKAVEFFKKKQLETRNS